MTSDVMPVGNFCPVSDEICQYGEKNGTFIDKNIL